MEIGLFNQFRSLIHQKSGISLSDEKMALLQARVGKRLRALQMNSERDYFKMVEADESGDELVKLLDVISTNTTYFHREHEHFAFFAQALREACALGKRELKVWCAASSSGEEPYQLAMTVRENVDLAKTNVRILATDISTNVLNKALAGQYAEEQLDKLPNELRRKYFHSVETPKGERWAVGPELKGMILFKRMNLSEFPYPLRGSFDFIFCRNVMIYFDNPLRAKVIAEFEKLLAPKGFLVLSKTESLVAIPNRLFNLGTSIYRKG